MSIISSIGRMTAATTVLLLACGTTGRAAANTPATTPGVHQSSVGRVLSLDDAILLTREGHLALRAAGFAFDAARARTRGAGRIPNPSLAAGHENFGLSLGTERAETSFLFEQPFELGGDRAARAGLAGANVDLARAQQDHLARVLEGETVERFCDTWVLQQRVHSLREAEQVAERSVAAAEERLKAGAAPAFERTRALGFRALREIERRRAESELESARELLALQWGADGAGFDSVALPGPTPIAVPPLGEMVARLEAHPGLRRAAAERAAAGWRIREARAARMPDLHVGAGIRRLSEVDGTGLVVGLSLPFPLWNRGGGSIAAAESDNAAAAARERQTAVELRGELGRAYRRLVASISAWEGLRDRVRPAAEEAMRLISAGYRAGRLGYLDIQEGQRSLLEANLLVIDGSAEVWRMRSALERLVGVRLDAPAPEKEER